MDAGAQNISSVVVQILVPLTNSLYVRGSLSDASHVIVDVGTGFYVEKVRTHSGCSAQSLPAEMAR